MRSVVKVIAKLVIVCGVIGAVIGLVSAVAELSSGTFGSGLYVLACSVCITLLGGLVVIVAEIAEGLEYRGSIERPVSREQPSSITSIIAH